METNKDLGKYAMLIFFPKHFDGMSRHPIYDAAGYIELIEIFLYFTFHATHNSTNLWIIPYLTHTQKKKKQRKNCVQYFTQRKYISSSHIFKMLVNRDILMIVKFLCTIYGPLAFFVMHPIFQFKVMSDDIISHKFQLNRSAVHCFAILWHIFHIFYYLKGENNRPY